MNDRHPWFLKSVTMQISISNSYNEANLIYNLVISGNHNVSFGSTHVFAWISCQPKSGLFDRQRVQV